jgi:hypothetical protein
MDSGKSSDGEISLINDSSSSSEREQSSEKYKIKIFKIIELF